MSDLSDLLAEVPNASVRFWQCINEQHRRTGTVAWDEHGVAHCGECGLTSKDTQAYADRAVSLMRERAHIAGYCPMGCGQTLTMHRGTGRVTCHADGCPRPTAAAEILEDAETEHVVDIGRTRFTVRHPLRERLDDAAAGCTLHWYLAGLRAAPETPGWYRVTRNDRAVDGWLFTPVEEPADAPGGR